MEQLFLRRKIFMQSLALSILLTLSGCVYLVVGGIGALGGYVVSPDTVEGMTQNDEIAVWDAAAEIISIMGVIQEKNEGSGIIIAKISGADVTVMITQISETVVKVNVKARKAFLPKIAVAQDVYVKIMSELNE